MEASFDPDSPFDPDDNADPAPIMVLLVDDQAIIGEAIRRALAQDPDIHFQYCQHGEQAIAMAAEVAPTVVLQDLVMPGTDGLALVREYRAQPATRDVPIIVMSTKEEPAIKSAAFAAGANDYLVKLPDTVELIARIRYHSRSYRNLMQRNQVYRALRASQQKLLEINRELERMTNLDGMTGLANRRHFDECMAAEWKRGQRAQSPLSLLMIDVDDFKSYNDTYGHVAGDEALRSVAQALRSCCARPQDVAARFGGEEFVAVLPSTSSGGARLLAEKFRRTVEQLAIAHSRSSTGPVLTTSIGCATTVPQLDKAFTWQIECADQALYAAKHGGKNRVGIAD